jgi:uncharacterized protein (TIGR00369 family)
VSDSPPADEDGFSGFVGLVEGAVGDGTASVSLAAGERHLNPGCTVHGGAIATLIDLAMGRAVNSLIDADERPVTVEMKVNYLEAGEPGELVAEARVTRQGRRFTVVHDHVTQSRSGETVAEAMATFTSV